MIHDKRVKKRIDVEVFNQSELEFDLVQIMVYLVFRRDSNLGRCWRGWGEGARGY